MRPESKKYLFDIKQAAELVIKFTEAKTFADYEADELLRSAVERQFMIVGEALVQLTHVDYELGASISEHGRIIAFRDILVHGYTAIDDEVVWRIVTLDLPSLLAEVTALLDE
jgi:uncharacterized protein with HEPN domain